MTKTDEKQFTVKKEKTKAKYTQLVILIIITLFITQIIDCAIDSFIFVGISQLIQLKKVKAEELLRKKTVKKCRIFDISCKISRKIKTTFKIDYYLNFLPNIDSITGYGLGILCILIGVFMFIYFLFIFTKLWNMWCVKKSMLDVILGYKSYFLLFLTIVFNFAIMAMIFVFNQNSQKTYENVNLKLLNFERDYVRHTKIIQNDPDYTNIVQSITRIRMYFYINNIRIMICMASLLFLSSLTATYLMISICC